MIGFAVQYQSRRPNPVSLDVSRTVMNVVRCDVVFVDVRSRSEGNRMSRLGKRAQVCSVWCVVTKERALASDVVRNETAGGSSRKDRRSDDEVFDAGLDA